MPIGVGVSFSGKITNSILQKRPGQRPEETVMSHEHTTKCLLTIADQFQTKADILEEGGIESLVALISNPDPLVLQNTLLVLELLSQDYECRIALNQANVVAPLLEAVKSEYPAIQGLVLKVLYLVCQEECVRVAMGEANGLETLLAFLKDEEMKDLHKGKQPIRTRYLGHVTGYQPISDQRFSYFQICDQCSWGVYVGSEPAGCDEGQWNLIPIHFTFISPLTSNTLHQTRLPEDLPPIHTTDEIVSNTPTPTQLNALRAIGACCQVGDNAKILHDSEIETTILSVLGSESSEVLAQACYTVSVLVNNPLCKETLAKIGVIQALMGLIGNDDEKVQEMSALSLANLSLCNRMVCLDILHDEHMPTMVEALESSQNPRVLTYLSHVIFNIVKFEPLREELVGYNVVQSLAASLTYRDADVCISVCKALAALVADESAREALLKTNGLGSLVTLLKEATNKEVLRKAAWTVGICVADEGMARELNKNGALRTLMDFVNNNTQGVSNLAVIALEKLLQYDLAAKYWHLGNLSQTDVIRDGFYDTGAHKPGEDFRSLKYLLDKSVDNKRPVLFISTLGADPEVPADLKSEASTTGSTTNIKTGRTTAKERNIRRRNVDIQPIRTRYLGHVTGYQPISDQCFSYFQILIPVHFTFISPLTSNTLHQTRLPEDLPPIHTTDEIVSNTPTPTQLNALRAIGACCQVGDNAKILHDSEIETTILSVLGSESSEVLAQACYTVSVLVNNPLCKETLAKIGIIQALMGLIGNDDEKVQEMSALSLANLSLCNRMVCLDILHDEHMPTMVEALESSQNPRVLTYLSHVIFNIVKFEPLREELVGYNVVQSLAASLTHRDTDVCISVCKALAALVADESAREALLKTSGLGSLVTLLKEATNKEVLRKAAWTVGICVADEGMARELNKNGALRTLMDFVNNNTQGVSNLAVIALEKLLQYDLAAKYWHLGNLSQTDVIRDGFYDTGAHKPGEDFRSLKYLLDKSVSRISKLTTSDQFCLFQLLELTQRCQQI
eukprot:sb/3461555/